jgi:copper chaperone
VSLKSQRALVWGPSLPPFDDVTAKIAKTGKEMRESKVLKEGDEVPVLEE